MERFIIISIFFLLIESRLVVINFDRIKDIYSDEDEDVSLNILNNNLYCNITVGKQTIPFFIAFDKELTFIVDNNYTFSKYETKKSNTFQKKSKELNNYIFDNLKFGFNATEEFDLMDEENNLVTIKDMPFVLGTYIEPKNNFKYPAQLGLKKRTYKNPFIFNFIEHLKLKRIISSQVFFFKFDGTEGGGQLFIGAYPHEFDKDYDAKYLVQTSSLEMGSSNNWFLHFKYIFYGDNKTDIESQIKELTPEKGMIILNMQFEKIFYESFFKDLINKKKCVRIRVKFNFNYVCQDDIDLSNFRKIKFRYIGMEFDFIFEAKDLFYHYYDRYFFLVSFRDSFYIFLGKPFFQKYNLIFNQDSKQIAIYSYHETTNKKIQKLNKIFPVSLIIIFTVLVGIFIYILFVYRLKKRRKNEIIENYEYTPDETPSKIKDTRLLEMTSSK